MKTLPDETEQDRIFTALQAGADLRTAAEYSGYTENLVSHWMNRGQEEVTRREQGLRARKREEGYANFFIRCQQNMANAKIRSIGLLAQAANEGEWRAAKALNELTETQEKQELERRNRYIDPLVGRKGEAK